MNPASILISAILLSVCPQMAARAQAQRTLSGTVVTGREVPTGTLEIRRRIDSARLSAISLAE
jgi:hypothetical protein